jgi:acetylornithine deacetylase/succinyl-diaminopimelate desuccinylase-like protein
MSNKIQNKEENNWRKNQIFPIEGDVVQEACKVLSDLIRLNTTVPPGNEIIAAEYCKKVLEKEGFENIDIIESDSGRGNIVCRWKGSAPKAKSLLLLAHLDVVPADPENWERNPFCGDIEGEYVWGRGALDCKGQVTAEMMAAIHLKRKGFQPKGDIIMCFTADEESGGEMGVGYLVRNHFEKVKTDYVINEGGGFLLPFGKNPTDYIVQTGEKGVAETKIRVKGVGGHGSMPGRPKENALYVLSKVVQKIAEFNPPIEIPDETRETAEKISLPGIAKKIFTSKRLIRPLTKLGEKLTSIPLTKVILPLVSDVMTPTVLEAGGKVNVIPQYADMIFDCRILPGHDRETIKNYLRKALGKKLFKQIEIIPIEPTQLATTNTSKDPFYELAEEIMNEMHPGAKLVPMLSAGSTDSKFFRGKGVYCLGHMPMRIDPNMSYSEMLEMAHGRNERLWIPNLSNGIEYFVRLIKRF